MSLSVVVVVDQLGYEDSKQLVKVQKELGPPRQFQLGFFPTLTETAHACISAASHPGRHGVVGSEACVRKKARELEYVNLVAEFPGSFPASQLAVRRLAALDWECFVVAGKSKVANLLDPRDDRGGAATRVTFVPDGAEHRIEAVDRDDEPITVPGILPTVPSLTDPLVDQVLFDWAHHILSDMRDDRVPTLLFLGLPRLDLLGHRHHRNSNEFTAALRSLDELLSEFIRDHELQDIVVTADHGYRPVSKMIVPSIDGWQLEVWPADPTGGDPELIDLPGDLLESHPRRPSGAAVIMDGGTARFWAREGRIGDLAEYLTSQLVSLGCYVTVPARLPTGARAWLGSSVHPHFGDVIAVAAEDLAFCKRAWVQTQGKVARQIVAEHGTDHDGDRAAPWWGPGTASATLPSMLLGLLP